MTKGFILALACLVVSAFVWHINEQANIDGTPRISVSQPHQHHGHMLDVETRKSGTHKRKRKGA